jgi:hypothetical protein
MADTGSLVVDRGSRNEMTNSSEPLAFAATKQEPGLGEIVTLEPSGAWAVQSPPGLAAPTGTVNTPGSGPPVTVISTDSKEGVPELSNVKVPSAIPMEEIIGGSSLYGIGAALAGDAIEPMSAAAGTRTEANIQRCLDNIVTSSIMVRMSGRRSLMASFRRICGRSTDRQLHSRRRTGLG